MEEKGEALPEHKGNHRQNARMGKDVKLGCCLFLGVVGRGVLLSPQEKGGTVNRIKRVKTNSIKMGKGKGNTSLAEGLDLRKGRSRRKSPC